MPNDAIPFKFSFEFIEPVERVMSYAQASLTSSDENRRAAAKAVIDVTNAAHVIQEAVAADGKVDLAPYLEFWFADAIECASSLVQGDDQDARDLARCLIDLEKATIKSKESFLAEMKRLGIRP